MKLIFSIFIFCFSVNSYAELPGCVGADVSKWDNCYGIYKDIFGGYSYEYSGQWKNGALNGQGKIQWGTELGTVVYEGEIQNNVRHGYGTHYYISGQYTGWKYIGNYVNDFQKGFGTVYRADGSISEQGYYQGGKLIESSSTDYKKQAPSNKSNITLDSAKQECEGLGFEKGTEKFGECVLMLSK